MSMQYEETEVLSVLDKFSNFDGTFQSTQNLRIEGQAKGTITCQGTLYVAEGAVVNATIDAENISVAGELEGEINCKGRMSIQPSGRVKGKIITQTLVVNEGAVYEGELQMSGTPASKRPNNPVPITSASDSGSGTTFIRRLGNQETAWEPDAADAAEAN